jgi:hypothetical protein
MVHISSWVTDFIYEFYSTDFYIFFRSQEEKKKIWLFESFALLGFCLLIYICDHTPYVLILLTIVTFVYTQLPWLCFNPDLRHWWHAMQTRWEEYQQHQDSMNRLQKQLNNEPPMKFITNARPAMQNEQMRNNRFVDFQQKPLNYGQNPRNFERHENQIVQNNEGSHIGNSMWSKFSKIPNVFKRPAENISPMKKEFSFMPSNTKLQHTDVNTSVGTNIDHTPPQANWFGNQLTRRPLRKMDHSYSSTPSNFSTDFSASLKSKFMSTFGFSGQHDVPPGLRNEGQNVCFMNSILQCLARTPNLGTNLKKETSKDTECSVAESVLLNTLAEILNQCMVHNSCSSLDPMAFRQAASTLHSVLVATPSQRQVQQDAAEFFMWLMDTVHTLLNKNRKGIQILYGSNFMYSM